MMTDGTRHAGACSAARLDGLLDSMEGFQHELSGSNCKRGAVRSRTILIELERCMDDIRAVLFQLLDPDQRSTVVRTFSETAGAKRAARLEVFLKDDTITPHDVELEEPECPEDSSPMQRTNSTMATYARKVRAVKSAYGAIKAVLDAKSQRLIERAVVSLEKEKISQERSLQAAEQPAGNPAAPAQEPQESGVLRAHYEALRCLNDALVQELENYRGENERLRTRVAELEQQDATDLVPPALSNLDLDAAQRRASTNKVNSGQHATNDMEAFEQKTDASSRPATQDLDSDRESDHDSNQSSGSGSEALLPQPRHTVSGLNLMSPYARWAQRLNSH
mmetsp:Transcript_71708/g.134111  ORF Transcript_71708/g.134111 Transcript_71708/m.134111 type:complete len:336 (-) Transcript_71708:73-1080(-)